MLNVCTSQLEQNISYLCNLVQKYDTLHIDVPDKMFCVFRNVCLSFSRDVANETLFEVIEIERKIQLAQEYQTNTTKLLNATDLMVKEIIDTSSKVTF